MKILPRFMCLVEVIHCIALYTVENGGLYDTAAGGFNKLDPWSGVWARRSFSRLDQLSVTIMEATPGDSFED